MESSSTSSSVSSAPPWSAASFAPSAPIRLGVVVNPRARRLRDEGPRRALREAARSALWAETSSTSDLPAAVQGLLRSGVNVLATAGGDGALHFVLNELTRHEERWPGVLLPLQGGTLNIVARYLQPALDPAVQLDRFARQAKGAPFGALAPRSIPLLRVVGESTEPRHGFLFGSEAVKNALELYDGFGGGYEGLSRFLFEVGRGYLLNTPLWQREKWRLTPPPFGLRVADEGQEHAVEAYSAAIACTLDLAIAGGAIRTLRRAPGARGFHARVIRETRTGPLLRMIPALMRGVSLEAVLDVPEATRLHLHGSFTLDGECFGASTRAPQLPSSLLVEASGEVSLVG